MWRPYTPPDRYVRHIHIHRGVHANHSWQTSVVKALFVEGMELWLKVLKGHPSKPFHHTAVSPGLTVGSYAGGSFRGSLGRRKLYRESFRGRYEGIKDMDAWKSDSGKR